MKTLLTAVELCALGFIVSAFWLFDLRAGLVATGVALLVAVWRIEGMLR